MEKINKWFTIIMVCLVPVAVLVVFVQIDYINHKHTPDLDKLSQAQQNQYQYWKKTERMYQISAGEADIETAKGFKKWDENTAGALAAAEERFKITAHTVQKGWGAKVRRFFGFSDEGVLR